MNNIFIKFTIIFFLATITAIIAHSQYDWKFSKEKDGIKVYESETKNSNLKAIKVECTIEGTYDKLISLLNNVSRHKEWVYNNKISYVLKKNSDYDLYYYTETSLPWPMSNRDAIIHLTMKRDSLDRFLQITGTGLPKNIPEKSGKVRVPRTSVSWYVTKPTATTLKIIYTFDADPGGSLPSWLVNMFADKGPFESFKKLSKILKE